ncbi:MAG TPA: V4R domain-containing protein [Kofleriaceae bacterium]|nr:V4R domain-containing protein [Kofleriaceae bacterium]
MLETIIDAPLDLDDGFDVFALDAYDDARLDDLRFGVICLDERGTVLRYNLAEARLARLDRTRVIGRNFFRTIAPCTATADFEGRFRSFIIGREPRVSFPYVFDFKFGAQDVTVEMVRASTAGRFYLCINRLAYHAARPAFERVAAPRQAELAPDEQASGVQRDDNAQRVVVLPATALRALRLTWDRVAPQGWSLFAAEWGLRWGRLMVMDLETALMERFDHGLRELPIDDALETICKHIQQDGWGQVSIDCTSPAATSRGAAVITIERSAIGEASGASEMPRCQLIAGLLRALLGHVSQRLLAIREVRCVAQGAPRCELLAVAQARRAKLEAAVEGAGDVRAALTRLDGAGGAALRAGDVLARLF